MRERERAMRELGEREREIPLRFCLLFSCCQGDLFSSSNSGLKMLLCSLKERRE
jgi:hypothetical protein